jgi:regulator of vacuolar morphogenesis
VKSIEDSPDARWRECPEWRSFLGFPAQPSRRNSTGSDIPQRMVMTPAAWLDLHANLKSQLQEARSHLARREAQGTSAGQAHEASAAAKRGLVKSNTLILRLEEGLKGLDVGEGELRRRRDLVGRARKEREGLEGLLNAWVVRSPALGAQNESSVAEGRKTELFGSAAAARSRSPGMGESPGKMPGAFPMGRKGRVLGGPARETERTREKDNQEVLMLQKQIMQEQDMDVEEITKTVRRLKELGVVINQEVVEQSQLLDVLDQDADRYSLLVLILIRKC